jgi:hypothetical protein
MDDFVSLFKYIGELMPDGDVLDEHPKHPDTDGWTDMFSGAGSFFHATDGWTDMFSGPGGSPCRAEAWSRSLEQSTEGPRKPLGSPARSPVNAAGAGFLAAGRPLGRSHRRLTLGSH